MFDDHDYQAQATLRHAIRHFLHFSEEQARHRGITPQQHFALLSIRGSSSYPKVTVGEVAEALQMRHHSASLLVDSCVKRDLLMRREDPEDRRRVMLSLTTDGQQVLDDITQANRLQLHELDFARLQRSLGDVHRAASEPRDLSLS